MTDSLHCNCVDRIKVVLARRDEFALIPMNINNADFEEKLGHRLIIVICATCDCKFYVGRLSDLEPNLPYWTEKDICKVRGHSPADVILTSNPPQNRCKWCGTVYRDEYVQRDVG